MKIEEPLQSIDQNTPTMEGFEINRRPVLGFSLLIFSVIATVAMLIYFGARASADRIENRAIAAGVNESQIDNKWWEDGLILACPLH